MTMHIVTAYPERAEGPGWRNEPLWIVVRVNGDLREVCLQPDEQTDAMRSLFRVCEAAHVAMKGAVEWAMRKDCPAKASISRQIGESR